VATLTEAVDQIRQICQSLIPAPKKPELHLEPAPA
jgi:hypothetical protein